MVSANLMIVYVPTKETILITTKSTDEINIYEIACMLEPDQYRTTFHRNGDESNNMGKKRTAKKSSKKESKKKKKMRKNTIELWECEYILFRFQIDEDKVG